MKKRLLITSIVMMLVVAVALSTATYAWFTSNTTVSASTMTLKAATSDKSALAIGWSGKTAGTFISSNINEILDPMAPNIKNWDATANENAGDYVGGALTNGLTTYEINGGNQKFYTSDIKQEGSKVVFSNTGAKVNPVVYTENASDAIEDSMTGEGQNSFYIINMSSANVLDKVVVSGLFTQTVTIENVKYVYIPADTHDSPNTEITYYLNDAKTAMTGAAIQADGGFKNTNTYYTLEPLYFQTNDETFQEDTQYYVVDAGEEDGYKLADVTIGENTTNAYYEKRSDNGDDMLRIAIFTKEYRYTNDGSVTPNKTYYKIDKATGVLSSFFGSDLTSAGVTNPKSDKYLEIDQVNDVPVDNHVLLGVLGKEETKYTLASSYDMNAVYFSVTFEEDDTVTEDNFAAKKDGLYTQIGSSGTYQLATTYSDSETYYKVSSGSQVDIPTLTTTYNTTNSTSLTASAFFATGNYYTAKNTVANGPIAINGAVNAMNYYNTVTTTLDLAVDLQPGEFVDIIAVAWLDGTVLDDTRSGAYAQVSLKFDSVRDQHQSNNAN